MKRVCLTYSLHIIWHLFCYENSIINFIPGIVALSGTDALWLLRSHPFCDDGDSGSIGLSTLAERAERLVRGVWCCGAFVSAVCKNGFGKKYVERCGCDCRGRTDCIRSCG